MRQINTESIGNALIDMIREASFELLPEVEMLFASISSGEEREIARETMNILIENSRIARQKNIPLCQDCGSVSVFLEIGRNLVLEGKPLDEMIDEAVRAAYERFYLRKSIAADPLRRTNTGTNTPAFIHSEIVEGDKIKIFLYLKGGGSENMTCLKMFRPTETIDAIIDYIETVVISAGPNPCPPLFIGVGIGGTADVAMLNSKKAVMRGIGTAHRDRFYADIERTLMNRLNNTRIGPLGFGGMGTVAGVFIIEAPTHIATLPVALNLNCHSLRYRIREI